MGFLRKLFGMKEDDDASEPAAPEAAPNATVKGKPQNKAGRPPLPDVSSEPQQSIDDVLRLRDAGDHAGARKLLAQIDKGTGLRTVLRAAMALEDKDDDEVERLLTAVAAEVNGWKLALQLAAALEDAERARRHVERAVELGAPAWALGWTRAMSTDATTSREGLVELLFADAPLARTVAARDLNVGEVLADAESAARYASFAHGRDSIRRFGAPAVASLVERALGAAR